MSSSMFGFSGPGMPNYEPGVRSGYGVENPTDWNPNSQYNTGIGADWFSEMDKWKSVKDGTMGYDPKVAGTPLYQADGSFNPEWGTATQGRGSDGWMYVGDDGKRYIIRDIPGLPAAATDPEAVNSGARLPGLQPGEGAGYSVTPLHQKNEWVGYNGIPHDMFDKEGNYTDTKLPQNLGHDKFWRDAAALAAIMATAGTAAYVMAPAAAGTAAAGATLGEGALAASGGYGMAAGTAGAAGTNAALAGAAGAGSASTAGGSGAFLGEGVESGVAAWDGAAGGAAGGYGTVPLAGTAAPTAPGAGAPATSAVSAGGSTAGSSGGLSSSLGAELFSVPGIGSVSTADLLKLGMTAYGAYSGSQGQEVTTTSTKELPEWLQGPVYGQGGVIPQSQWLMNQQLGGTGGLLATQAQLKAQAKKKKDKEKARKGLL